MAENVVERIAAEYACIDDRSAVGQQHPELASIVTEGTERGAS
jgi:hypothetical protein